MTKKVAEKTPYLEQLEKAEKLVDFRRRAGVRREAFRKKDAADLRSGDYARALRADDEEKATVVEKRIQANQAAIGRLDIRIEELTKLARAEIGELEGLILQEYRDDLQALKDKFSSFDAEMRAISDSTSETIVEIGKRRKNVGRTANENSETQRAEAHPAVDVIAPGRWRVEREKRLEVLRRLNVMPRDEFEQNFAPKWAYEIVSGEGVHLSLTSRETRPSSC